MKIATHDGVFHADDVMAYAILCWVYTQQSDTTTAPDLIRTRDRAQLDAADVVFDVGGVYDPARGRFDHHQPGGAGARDNGIAYSSAGLIGRHFLLPLLGRRTYGLIDAVLLAPIDAVDNGQRLATPTFPGVFPFNISQVLGGFNPPWNTNPKSTDFDLAFLRAVDIAMAVLNNEIQRARSDELALTEVQEARGDKILVLERFVPWTNHISVRPRALFVVFPTANGGWNVQGVPDSPGSKSTRVPFPSAWAGLVDLWLAQESGVDDAVFCHRNLFIAGAKTQAGAIALAREAIEAFEGGES